MRFRRWSYLLVLKKIRPRNLTCLCLLVIQAASSWSGTPAGGFLTGVIREHSGAVMDGVEVRITNESTGALQQISSDENGRFVSTELIPGTYRVTLRRRGFRTASYPGFTVGAGQLSSGNFTIEILPLQQEVTVESSLDTSDPTTNGVAVSRHSPESAYPANGRDLHAYYAIVPGATSTPASTSDGGQFTVSGQRPNTNTVRVDGVSANTGLGISAQSGTYPGSSLPAMTAIGSTQSIASQEEIERTELRSTDFSAASGERPGAQILIETRSGSNDLHGSAFGLLRPRTLDSKDWFARKYQAPLAASSLNGFGASLGGALLANRTFFFAAFENENVSDTAMQLMAVPSLQTRAAAHGGIGLILNAFPEPSGPSLDANSALGTSPLKQQASVSSYSARIDQVLGDKARLFARYLDTPSHSATQQLGNMNAKLSSTSLTVGLTGMWSKYVHDFRLNFSQAADRSSWAAGSASQQILFDALTPPHASPNNASLGPGEQMESFLDQGRLAALSISGIGQLISGTPAQTHQKQWEGVYTLSKQWSRHESRFGGDYIQLIPETPNGAPAGIISAVSVGIEQLQAAVPLGITTSSGTPVIPREHISIGSVFAQDTFHINNRLTVLYGLRWELTPPTNRSVSESLLTGIGTWVGPGASVNSIDSEARLGKSTWPINYTQLAPRFGLAYRLHGPTLILRAGAGVFYETALGSLINPVNLSPLNSWQFAPLGGTIPASPMPAIGESVPPSLSLPRIWEWRASVERSVGNRSILSLAYVGSAGSKLLRLEGTTDTSTGILQQTYFTNYGRSDYQALETQFRGNLSANVSTLISYTWGHSTDNGSQGSAVYLAQPVYAASLDRASSDFDIRHNVNASISYRSPSGFSARRGWLRNWTLSTTAEARTGFPFDVTTADRSIGLAFANTARPNLVSSQAIWIQNKSAPWGKVLNSNAFQLPETGVNGNLGRNILRGAGLFQIDASLRRQFRVRGRSSIETAVSAFNLLNHAGFSKPTGYLGSPLFGQPVSMQNLMMGSGNPTNGLTPVFQSGGPRTVEIGVKFTF
jgi:hypothetical protein